MLSLLRVTAVSLAIGFSTFGFGQGAPYPHYLLKVPSPTEAIGDNMSVSSFELDASEFYHFIQEQIHTQAIFFFSLELPWSMNQESLQRFTVVDYQHLTEDGEQYYAAMGRAEFLLPKLDGFNHGFFRQRDFRGTETTQFQGFYQSF